MISKKKKKIAHYCTFVQYTSELPLYVSEFKLKKKEFSHVCLDVEFSSYKVVKIEVVKLILSAHHLWKIRFANVIKQYLECLM